MPAFELDAMDGLKGKLKAEPLYWSCFLLGCGFLTPWSSFLSAVDYFNDIYPGDDTLRWISVCYIPTVLIVIGMNGLIPAKDRGQTRILCGITLFIFTMLFIPIMDLSLIKNNKGTDLTFSLLMLCASINGIADGLSQGSFTGLALYLPPKYYQIYLSGMGCSAVLIVSLRVITKAALTDSTNGLRISACIFFFSSVLICFGCWLAQKFIVIPHPFFKETLPNDERPLTEVGHQADVQKTLWERIGASVYVRVAKKLKAASFSMLMIYVVTLCIFPGVPSDVECDALGSWYGIILVAAFAIVDLISRSFPGSWYVTHPVTVLSAVLGRVLLIPITFVVVRSAPNPFLITILILALGLSNGYLTVCTFGMGREKMMGASESFIGGNVLVFALMIGLTIGSLLSMVWAVIV